MGADRADGYQVPQILEARGVLRYSEALKSTILSKTEIPAGCVRAIDPMRRFLDAPMSSRSDSFSED